MNKQVASLLVASIAMMLSTSRLFAETIEIKEITNIAVYGATTAPRRNPPVITTRWNSSRSPYGITSFLLIPLSSLPKGSSIESVKFVVKTATHVHADGTHSVVLGHTVDEFDPAGITVATFDGVTPWSQGHNAGIDPGARKHPNVLASLHHVTGLDTWYTFESPELTSYIQEQAKEGRDAFLYLAQGTPGTAGEFVIFHGPSSEFSPYLQVELSPK